MEISWNHSFTYPEKYLFYLLSTYYMLGTVRFWRDSRGQSNVFFPPAAHNLVRGRCSEACPASKSLQPSREDCQCTHRNSAMGHGQWVKCICMVTLTRGGQRSQSRLETSGKAWQGDDPWSGSQKINSFQTDGTPWEQISQMGGLTCNSWPWKAAVCSNYKLFDMEWGQVRTLTEVESSDVKK